MRVIDGVSIGGAASDWLRVESKSENQLMFAEDGEPKPAVILDRVAIGELVKCLQSWLATGQLVNKGAK